MVKHSVVIVLAGILVLLALPAGAAGAKWIEDGELFKVATVLMCVPLEHPGYGMTAQELPMKDDLKTGEPYPMGDRMVFPLCNLDLFQIDSDEQVPVQARPDDLSGLQIIVILPDAYAKKLTKGRIGDIKGLAFWDPAAHMWVPLEILAKEGAVSPSKRTKAGIWFEVYHWPLGDRVIGCW
jgi:hypothetical protein